MKILTIVESAYCDLPGQQDDPILWLSRTLKKSGDELTVLLRGHAVDCIAKQACPQTSPGAAGVSGPAKSNPHLSQLRKKGYVVYAVDEDLKERGIDSENCIHGVRRLPLKEVATLVQSHTQVWHW